MTVDELKKYRQLKKQISDLKDRLDVLANPKSLNLDFVPSKNFVPKTLDGIILKRQKILKQYIEKIEESEELVFQIESELKEIKEPTIETAIRLKFIDGKTWEQVGEELGYDYSYLRKKVYQAIFKSQEKNRNF